MRKRNAVEDIERVDADKAEQRPGPRAISVELPHTVSVGCANVAREMGDSEVWVRALVRDAAVEMLAAINPREIYAAHLRRKIEGLARSASELTEAKG